MWQESTNSLKKALKIAITSINCLKLVVSTLSVRVVLMLLLVSFTFPLSVIEISPSYSVLGREKDNASKPDREEKKESRDFNPKQDSATIDKESKSPNDRPQNNFNDNNGRVDYGDRIIRSVSDRQEVKNSVHENWH